MNSAGPNAKTALSYTAAGVVVPHSLADVQHALARTGWRVWVQDIVRLRSFHEQLVAITDGLVRAEPDLVAVVDHVGLLPEVIPLLEKPPRVLSWFYDNPLDIVRDDFLSMNSRYHLFCWDRAYVPELKRRGFEHVYYQPFATNPEVYRPHRRVGFEYDVSFVGNCSPNRASILLDLAGHGITVDVFGDAAWSKVRHRCLRYHGAADNRRECPLIYSRSKINLNISSEQLITSLPVRVFDVLAAGGFLLTDHRADVDELFRPGQDVAVYENGVDLCWKAFYYLGADEERARIIDNGRARVLDRFTFEKTLPQMIRQVFEAGNGAHDREPDPKRLAASLWLVGLSYLKFDRFAEAASRLTRAMQLCPRDERCLLAVALLNARWGRAAEAEPCVAALAAMGSPHAETARTWLTRPPTGPWVDAWRMLYGMVYPDVCVKSDGTIPDWDLEPVPGAPPAGEVPA